MNLENDIEVQALQRTAKMNGGECVANKCIEVIEGLLRDGITKVDDPVAIIRDARKLAFPKRERQLQLQVEQPLIGSLAARVHPNS